MGHTKDAVWRYFGAEVDLSVVSTALRAQPLRISGGSIPLPDTDMSFLTGALHFLVKLPDGPVQPYIGIGPAVIHSKVDAINAGPSLSVKEQSATALGISGIAGMRFRLAEQFGAFLEYKQIRAALDFDNVKGDAVIHAGAVGFNFLF